MKLAAVVGGIVRSRRIDLAVPSTSGNLPWPRRLVCTPWHPKASFSPFTEGTNVLLTRRGDKSEAFGQPEEPHSRPSLLRRLKWALGLGSRSDRHNVNKRNISFVRSCFGLPGWNNTLDSAITEIGRDVVFISIDTEFRSSSGTITELGVALLDTRNTKFFDPGSRAVNWCSKMRAFHYHVGEKISRRKLIRRFRFGTSEKGPQEGLASYLLSLFEPDREYVLVGHSLGGDLERLRPILGQDLRDLPNVIAEIDTWDIVKHLPVPNSLERLWERLGGISPYMSHLPSNTRDPGFHNAGNDAVYTLHTLLMLAMDSEATDNSQNSLLRLIRSLILKVSKRTIHFTGHQPTGSPTSPAMSAYVQPTQSKKTITLKKAKSGKGRDLGRVVSCAVKKGKAWV